MKRLFVVYVLSFFSTICFAQQTDELKKETLRLLELNGAISQMQSTKDSFFKYVPKDKQADFSKDFESLLPELKEKYVKAYMKIFTLEDVKAMIAFYESPVGKKMQANSTEMGLRNKVIAQEWSLKLEELVNKYRYP